MANQADRFANEPIEPTFAMTPIENAPERVPDLHLSGTLNDRTFNSPFAFGSRYV